MRAGQQGLPGKPDRPWTSCHHSARRSVLLAIAVASFAWAAASPLRGQTTAPIPPVAPFAMPLPDAPGSLPARLQGVIADPSGALIPGARILLHLPGQRHNRETLSDNEGHFFLSGLDPGQYSFIVAAAGFSSYQSLPFQLQPGADRQLDTITLSIPAGHADAYVTLNREQIAAAELHAAEQQRIVGFPDFYTSFVWNAAPLDARQKLSLGLHATTDRMAFVTAGLVAGAEQINNTFPQYGDGAQGFGKRYGAAYADGFTGKFIGAALLPAVFRQDPRYFYMGPASPIRQRIRHAVASAFLTRGDHGQTELNYSHILGNASAGALSAVYHPAANSAASLAWRNALLGTAGEAGVNIVRELFLKRFVHGGDVDANGKP